MALPTRTEMPRLIAEEPFSDGRLEVAESARSYALSASAQSLISAPPALEVPVRGAMEALDFPGARSDALPCARPGAGAVRVAPAGTLRPGAHWPGREHGRHHSASSRKGRSLVCAAHGGDDVGGARAIQRGCSVALRGLSPRMPPAPDTHAPSAAGALYPDGDASALAPASRGAGGTLRARNQRQGSLRLSSAPTPLGRRDTSWASLGRPLRTRSPTRSCGGRSSWGAPEPTRRTALCCGTTPSRSRARLRRWLPSSWTPGLPSSLRSA